MVPGLMTDPWTGRRVLVTGATGMVGSWLVAALLDRGAHVTVFVRDWSPQSELLRSGSVNGTFIVQGKLEDLDAVERSVVEQEVDTVFHLGAQTLVEPALRSPLATFEANIRGSYHVLESCRRHSSLVRRVLVASSDKAYGESKVLPYSEDMPLLGRAPYDVSKACVDMLAQAYHQSYGLPVAIARCGNIYGGGDLNWSRIVPGTIRSLLQGMHPLIRSDGTLLRDYIFVKDVVDGFLRLANIADQSGVAGEAFNFAPGSPIAVTAIVGQLQHLLGREDLGPVIQNRARAEIDKQHLSSKKARRVLGWAPQYTLEQGLAATIPWYVDFLGAER